VWVGVAISASMALFMLAADFSVRASECVTHAESTEIIHWDKSISIEV
jgi:hypothetical protein